MSGTIAIREPEIVEGAEKMFCQNCGALVPTNATFCEDCHRRMFGQTGPVAPADAPVQPPECQQPVYPPPVSDYLEQQSSRPQYVVPSMAAPSAASRSAKNARLAAGFSCGTMGLGVLIFLTTFLPWISTGFGYWSKPSGWTVMLKGSELAGNFIWIKIPGFLYFSGIWSMLAGLAVIAGSVMLLKGIRAGQYVAGIGAVIGVGTATVNIIMTNNYEAGIGIGVWLFAIFSVLAVIGAELAWRYSA